MNVTYIILTHRISIINISTILLHTDYLIINKHITNSLFSFWLSSKNFMSTPLSSQGIFPRCPITIILSKSSSKEAAGEPPPWKLIFTLQFFSISFLSICMCPATRQHDSVFLGICL